MPAKQCRAGGDGGVTRELLRAGRHANQQLHNPIIAATSPGAGDTGAFGVARLQRAAFCSCIARAVCAAPRRTHPRMSSPERDTYHGVSELPSGMLGLSLCKAPAESGVPQLGTALNEEHPSRRSLPARRAAPPCRRYTPLAVPDELTQAKSISCCCRCCWDARLGRIGKDKGRRAPHQEERGLASAFLCRFEAGRAAGWCSPQWLGRGRRSGKERHNPTAPTHLHSLLCVHSTHASNKSNQNALQVQLRHFLLQIRLFKPRAWQKASQLTLLQTEVFWSLRLAPFRKETEETRRHHVPSVQKLSYSDLLLAALAAPSRTRPPPLNEKEAHLTTQISIT